MLLGTKFLILTFLVFLGLGAKTNCVSFFSIVAV